MIDVSYADKFSDVGIRNDGGRCACFMEAIELGRRWLMVNNDRCSANAVWIMDTATAGRTGRARGPRWLSSSCWNNGCQSASLAANQRRARRWHRVTSRRRASGGCNCHRRVLCGHGYGHDERFRLTDCGTPLAASVAMWRRRHDDCCYGYTSETSQRWNKARIDSDERRTDN